jgi:hypothetical protein
MKKASEYRQHAHECRQLAASMASDEQRALMLQMADHWDKLAADRIDLIRRHPELAHAGERDEERFWEATRKPD